MLAQEVVAHQHHARAAVGHLTAVEAADAALDGRVDDVVVADRGQIGHPPVARLGVGVALGVGEVDGGDRAQVGVLDAEAAVVLLGDLGEHRGPEERRLGALVPGPGRRAEVLGGDVAGTVFSSSSPTTSAVR